MKTIEETDRISAEDRRLLDEIKNVVQGFLPNTAVLLYGSVARGRRDADSDYDILVLADDPFPFDQQEAVRDALYDLQRSHGVLVSTIFRARSAWEIPIMRASPFRKEVERDAILL